MPLIVSPIAVPGVAFSATLYKAYQVRFVEPNSGIVHFVDGSTRKFSNNTTPAATFVPSANAGNVVPNPGDWLLDPRAVADPVPAVAAPGSSGTEPLDEQFQVPGVPVAVFGAYYYYTRAQFEANFSVNYTNGLVVNQIVP